MQMSTAFGQQHASCSYIPRQTFSRRAVAAKLKQRRSVVSCRAENKEYYDYKDMPPLPLTVSKIYIPKLGYTVVEKANEPQRMASLAIFYDIYKDDQYKAQLTRKSAITALCMYDRDDVEEAQRSPGAFPNIDLLHRVYNEGLELDFCVQEFDV
ncbi:hypothetical protein DUNSADRAFT_4844 [Dunaliella salina]|uniref:Uncharacterized protein n=1 Tax=Dunaliella salina TaxID=3046 RepID=A0ABQ7GR90_DUNSA|nr:hypothetical protein DUNSADRAFT_4844 [Dunaliella salina]|eukprot:KAF5837121.1 hypothetical protein DUNSADRAFT_4844 [Dunaliella salina]